MGKRARLPSPDCTRIAILGLLCRHGEKHGYELRRLIEAQHINDISNVQFGSIYAALKRLGADGFVEEVGRSQEGGRPARTTYRVTKLGKKELRRLLADAFLNAEQPERPVDLAVHFSGLLPVEDVAELLERRIEALDAYHAGIERLVAATEHPDPPVHELIDAMADHFGSVNRVERQWSERVLARVRSGGYRTGSVELAE